jgi:hypothetical protein
MDMQDAIADADFGQQIIDEVRDLTTDLIR